MSERRACREPGRRRSHRDPSRIREVDRLAVELAWRCCAIGLVRGPELFEQRRFLGRDLEPVDDHDGTCDRGERSPGTSAVSRSLRAPPAIPTNATDIPGFSKSSSGRGVVCRGGVFVVEGVGLQAAVQDADELGSRAGVARPRGRSCGPGAAGSRPVLPVIRAVSRRPIAGGRRRDVGCGRSGPAPLSWCQKRGCRRGVRPPGADGRPLSGLGRVPQLRDRGHRRRGRRPAGPAPRAACASSTSRGTATSSSPAAPTPTPSTASLWRPRSRWAASATSRSTATG